MMFKMPVPFLLVLLVLTSCATSRFPWAGLPRFHEQDQANFIVRYYSDDTSYVLKPQTTEGGFLTVLKKDAVLDVAKRQADRQLAVVILIHYGADSQAEAVQDDWRNLLAQAGYQRIVFLRGERSTQVNGLRVLANGG